MSLQGEQQSATSAAGDTVVWFVKSSSKLFDCVGNNCVSVVGGSLSQITRKVKLHQFND